MCIHCDPNKYTHECDFCGRSGCKHCLEHWAGQRESQTGYSDDHWVCGDCLAEELRPITK